MKSPARCCIAAALTALARHLWTWGDEQRNMTPARWGINGNVDKRLQRYIGARLGPLPGWTMGYGFDLDEWVKVSELDVWRDYMHDHLGWPHLLGGRPAGPNRGTDHSQYGRWNGPLDYANPTGPSPWERVIR